MLTKVFGSSDKLGTTYEQVAAVTAAYTVGENDDLVQVNAIGGAIAITINSSSNPICRVQKTDSSANAVTVTATINGASNYALTSQNQSAKFIRLATGAWLALEGLPEGIAVASELNAFAALIPTTLVSALTDNSGGATADGTIGLVTAPSALTDSTGGTASTTLAAQTLPTSPGSGADGTTPNGAQWTAAVAQLTALRNVSASLAARQAEDRTAIVALTDAVKELSTEINLILARLKTATIISTV